MAGVFVYSRDRLETVVWNTGDKSVRKIRTWKWYRPPRVLALIALSIVVPGCGPAPESSLHEDRTSSREAVPPAANRYDLARDEERGGHTLQRHVARTDAQLRERLQRERNISAASTWTDRETAETVVAEGLAAERGPAGELDAPGLPARESGTAL